VWGCMKTGVELQESQSTAGVLKILFAKVMIYGGDFTQWTETA